MNRRHIAALLIACAIILSAGAFFVLTESPETDPSYRHSVAPPPEDVKAPAWVDKGQTQAPDYTSAEAKAQNATPAPEVKEPAKPKEPEVIEVKEDKVVTLTFVESLSNFFLNKFIPVDSYGNSATGVSAKSVNMFFGHEMDGFAVPTDDIRSARKTVLDYVFNPTMLKALDAAYTPAFVAMLVDSATQDERDYKIGVETEKRNLTKAETAEMLRLNSAAIKQTATIFRIIASDTEIANLAGKYLRSAKAVERANGQLQTAIADEKDPTKAGQRLKQAIMQRERMKSAIVSRIRKQCPNCNELEAFYLAQWAYRRVLSEPEKRLPTFETAAEILDNLADKLLGQAASLTQ